jgi:hypothetical protein
LSAVRRGSRSLENSEALSAGTDLHARLALAHENYAR